MTAPKPLDRQKIKCMQRLIKLSTRKGRYDQANLDAVREELTPAELTELDLLRPVYGRQSDMEVRGDG